MKDEEHHIDFLETQLGLVEKVGVELYSQHHIGELKDRLRICRIAAMRYSMRGGARIFAAQIFRADSQRLMSGKFFRNACGTNRQRRR